MTQPIDKLLADFTLAEAQDDLETAKTLLETVRLRIDEIKEHTDKLYAEGKRLSTYRAEFQTSAAASKSEADRVYDRLLWCMSQAGFIELPGTKWRAHVQAGAQVLDLDQEATAEIALKYPKLVKRDIVFSWDKEKVQEHLAAKQEFEYGRLRDNHFVKFYVKKG